eukprot:scaffold26_cov397-Pavlova_lutheri.AAC.15
MDSHPPAWWHAKFDGNSGRRIRQKGRSLACPVAGESCPRSPAAAPSKTSLIAAYTSTRARASS